MTDTNTDHRDSTHLKHQQAEYADHRVAEVFGDLSPGIGPDGTRLQRRPGPPGRRVP